MGSDVFSLEDLLNALTTAERISGWASYLGTPSGVFRKFEPNATDVLNIFEIIREP